MTATDTTSALEGQERATPRHATRQQTYMTQAFDHVTAISGDGSASDRMRKIYGGLCHSFPVLVRTCGLCQALAFVEAKTTGGDRERVRAHQELRRDVAAVLGDESSDPLTTVRKEGMLDYMRHTRDVLDAWIYYKRFAVSILKVESAQEGQNAQDMVEGGEP